MKAPISWLRELVSLPEEAGTKEIANAFTRLGLTVEHIESTGSPVVSSASPRNRRRTARPSGTAALTSGPTTTPPTSTTLHPGASCAAPRTSPLTTSWSWRFPELFFRVTSRSPLVRPTGTSPTA